MNSMLVIALTAGVFSCTTAEYERSPSNACILPSFLLIYKELIVTSWNCGRKFDENILTEVPRLQWCGAKKTSLYTVLLHTMKDPPRLYWGVANINGSDLAEGWDISRQYTALTENVPSRGVNGSFQVLIYGHTEKIPTYFKLDWNNFPIKFGQLFSNYYFADNFHLNTPLAGLQLIFEI